MPALPEAIILVVAPFAPRFSPRVWLHAQRVILGAILAPRARPVTAAVRVMGVARARPCTTDPRVLNRATWSVLQASRMLVGVLLTRLGLPDATMVLGADDTVERRAGRNLAATGGDRDAGRSTTQPVLHGCGLTWVSMRRVVPVPWRRRVWAWPLLTG
jgi:hypothetical protein